MNLKVAFVVPESNLKLNDACAPLNLGYLASYLRKYYPSVDVKIFDGVAGQNVKEKIMFFHPDVIGLTATTPQAPFAYELANWIRRVFMKKPLLVMGGVHASALPEEAVKHVDCVVVGEGERAIVEIVERFWFNIKIPKIIYGDYVENLDDIPSPAFDLMDMKAYLKQGPPFPNLKHPILSMVTSRGCPFTCPFCRNSGRKEPVRYFSAQRVVDEIQFFIREYGVKSVFFNDDEFLVNKKRLHELTYLFDFYRFNKKIVWGCQARVKSIDAETLRLIKKMGCVVISPGFESASPRILNYLKCGTTTVRDNEQALKLAKQEGIIIGGSFIFGTPSETLAEMKQTFKWFEDNNDLKFIGINTLIPYPGTEVWNLCMTKGLLPKKIDYTKLVPTGTPKETYIVNKTVPEKTFNNFVVHIQRIAWILTQTRLKPSIKAFLNLAQYKTFWWMWLFHPLKILKIIVTKK